MSFLISFGLGLVVWVLFQLRPVSCRLRTLVGRRVTYCLWCTQEVRNSFNTRFHRKGESIPPWGHPFLIEITLFSPCSSTWIVRFLIIDMIHRLTVREVHLEFRASSMELKETLSKAPSTSRKVPSAIPWLRMENSSFRTSLCTVAMVELPLSESAEAKLLLAEVRGHFEVHLHVPEYAQVLRCSGASVMVRKDSALN